MVIAGRLNGLNITASQSGGEASYGLSIGAQQVHLNPLLGQGLRLTLRPQTLCGQCNEAVDELMRGGYCRTCFFALARCDSCFVSPSRCHHALGTCREPKWGGQVCLQPHLVYLANSSGIKVGLTQLGRQQQRWLAQGATQGLVIAQTNTRRDAGILEAMIAQTISDRTPWRKLVSVPPVTLKLRSLFEQLQRQLVLPEDCQWTVDEAEHQLNYPVLAYSPSVQHLVNEKTPTLADNLCGIKGQYLLMQTGAFNVARHVGLTLNVEVSPPHSNTRSRGDGQLALF